MENGVKNLKEPRLFPKTFSNHGFGDAYAGRPFLERLFNKYYHLILLNNFSERQE